MNSAPAPGFPRLRHDLFRRRLQRLEPRLRLELGALAAMLVGFVFWQLRIAFAGIAFEHGAGAAAAAMAALLLGIALAAALALGVRLHRRLTRAPAGPEWADLPIEVDRVIDHQAWEAELPVRWVGLAAVTTWIAASTIAPWMPWLVAGAAFVPLWWLLVRAGRALAIRVALGAAPARYTALRRHWEQATTTRRRPARATARWRRHGVIATLVLKDLKLARSRHLWVRGLFVVALAAVSIAAWWMPAEAGPLHSWAFILALLAAAAFGEWLVRLGGLDPFAILRGLPVDVRAVWASRMTWAAAATVIMVIGHAVGSAGSGPTVPVSLFWLTVCSLAIAALGIQYGLTLFPRWDQAVRLYALALALAVITSLMIFLLGWVTLFAAVAHSGRRLPRWWTLEERA